MSSVGRVQVSYALFKELEDIGDYPQAFYHLKIGADEHRRQSKYDVSVDIDAMQRITESYSHTAIKARRNGFKTEAPIFIVGLPLSGTTLLERMLSNHPDVRAGGELQHFPAELMRSYKNRPGSETLRPSNFIEDTIDTDFTELGEAYMHRCQPFVKEGRFFTDKLPINFLHLGAIKLALPHAKIICVSRDSMDVCFAMYKRLFKDAYPFSYNLNDIGRYYLAYRRLMAHWQQVFSGQLHTISYEDLVHKSDASLSAVLAYCNLDFHDSLSTFHQNPAVTTTASAVQVRNPIYGTSVGLWKNYKRELKELAHTIDSSTYAIKPSR